MTASASTSSRPAGHALVEALIAQGVQTCFGVPGESYLAVLDGFHVTGFAAALIGSLIYSVCGIVIDAAMERLFAPRGSAA